jgi:thiol:disulfide interchange protein DsbC
MKTQLLVAALSLALMHTAMAQEAVIRKNLAERFKDFPKIDEVSKTPVPGLYEVRLGTKVVYTDERGDHLIQGELVDTKNRVNLTQARVEKFMEIDFATLPIKDALTWKQGTGARQVVIFEDPNCGYCKKLEADLGQLKDVTIHILLLPVLGPESAEKARNIWCAKDKVAAWRDWMVKNTAPVRAMGQCDTAALQRIAAFAQQHQINGTPAIVFENNKRVPGAMSIEQIEQQLAASRLAKSGKS